MKFTSVIATSLVAAVAMADDAAAAPPAGVTDAPVPPEGGNVQFTTWATAYATTLQYQYPDGGQGQAQVYEQQVQGGLGPDGQAPGAALIGANNDSVAPNPWSTFLQQMFAVFSQPLKWW